MRSRASPMLVTARVSKVCVHHAQRAPGRAPNLSRSFDRIVTAAGLPNIVFHDLRRTAATMLKSLGVPTRDAQTILGHANFAVTLGRA